jgi:hypothetical protein
MGVVLTHDGTPNAETALVAGCTLDGDFELAVEVETGSDWATPPDPAAILAGIEVRQVQGDRPVLFFGRMAGSTCLGMGRDDVETLSAPLMCSGAVSAPTGSPTVLTIRRVGGGLTAIYPVRGMPTGIYSLNFPVGPMRFRLRAATQGARTPPFSATFKNLTVQ